MRSTLTSRLLLSVVLISAPLATSSVAAFAQDAEPKMSKPAAAAKLAPASKATPASATDYVVLKVNGDEIRRSEVMELWQSMVEGQSVPDFDAQDAAIKKNVLTGLVSEKLVLQQAQKAELEKDEAVARRLEMLRKQVLIQEWMARSTKDKLSEDALKAYYEKNVAQKGEQKEVHVRHILVKTPEEAKEVYTRLKKGDSFEEVAKELSLDQASGAKGGDIGWVSRERVVPEFSDAAFKLKEKEISKPVKTAFGWHVLQVLGSRTLQPKPFSEAKFEVGQQALSDATREVVSNLLKKADIQHLSPTGEKLLFDRSLPNDLAPKQ